LQDAASPAAAALLRTTGTPCDALCPSARGRREDFFKVRTFVVKVAERAVELHPFGREISADQCRDRRDGRFRRVGESPDDVAAAQREINASASEMPVLGDLSDRGRDAHCWASARLAAHPSFASPRSASSCERRGATSAHISKTMERSHENRAAGRI
jgi:hypothetical protein